MKNYVHAITLLLIVSSSLVPAVASSDLPKQFAVYQEIRTYNRGKQTSLSTAHVNWITTKAGQEPAVHLVSETYGACAAWIIDLAPNTQVNKIGFKCKKHQRGIISKKTSDPIVRLEFCSTSNPIKQYSQVPRSDMTFNGDDVECKLHQVALADPVIYRIAVCGIATKELIADYADMDVCDLKINGKQVALHTELTPHKDTGGEVLFKGLQH